MGQVVSLAFLAAVNPALLAAVTVMLLLPSPLRLMIGYWLGAMTTSVTLGMVIVFSLESSSFSKSSSNKAHPVGALVLAGILLVIVFVLATGRDQRLRERRARRRSEKRGKDEEKTPRWQQTLGKGTARAAFLVGLVLTFPGGAYLDALDHLSKLHYSTVATVLAVIGVCLIQQILLEGPIIAFKLAPEQTPIVIDRAKSWFQAHARTIAQWGLTVIAAALALNGILELV